MLNIASPRALVPPRLPRRSAAFTASTATLLLVLAALPGGCGEGAADPPAASAPSAGASGSAANPGGASNSAGTGGSGTASAGGSGTAGAAGSEGPGAGGAGASGVSGAAGSAGGSGGMGPGKLSVTWTPCPVDSNSTSPGAAMKAECADVAVPTHRGDPSRGAIDFFVKRIRSAQPSRAQLWLLNGGPGYSGADFESLAASVVQVHGDVDVYLPDHRGVGRSSRLSCPAAEEVTSDGGIDITDDEYGDCIAAMKQEWGSRLDGFTVSEAAHDVAGVIDATREQGQQIIVYGGSYGTVWAHRYMQLHPEQPTGVILDAVAVNSALTDQDRWANELGHTLLNICAADAFCSGKLPDPWQSLAGGLAALDAGQCQGLTALGIDRRFLQDTFGLLLYSWDYRELIPALIYRLERCSDADVNAFANLLQVLAGPADPEPSQRFFSGLLSMHIVESEMVPDPMPTLAQIEAERATYNVAHGYPTTIARYHDVWPTYPADPLAGPLAAFSGNLLLIHSELDFIPPAISASLRDHFNGPGQTYVDLPRTPHGAFQSPTVSGKNTCGVQVFKQFIDDPTVAVDTSCTSAIQQIDFDVSSPLAQAFLGTTDEWDGAPSITPPAPAPAPRARLASAIHRIRSVVMPRWIP
jgi:pimeloyl-ACP methyl ester carboxylesterase